MLKEGQGFFHPVHQRLAGRQKISRFVRGPDIVGGGSFCFIDFPGFGVHERSFWG